MTSRPDGNTFPEHPIGIGWSTPEDADFPPEAETDAVAARIHAARGTDIGGEISEGVVTWRPSLWDRLKTWWHSWEFVD